MAQKKYDIVYRKSLLVLFTENHSNRCELLQSKRGKKQGKN